MNPPVTVILVLPPGEFDAKPLRRQLRQALVDKGLLPVWSERLAQSPELPLRWQTHAAPLLLVDGKAVPMADEMALQQGLDAAMRRGRLRERWRRPLSMLSVAQGVLIAFFPKCAACWAAYFSVFNSMGIGIPYYPWLKHVLVGTLLLSFAYFLWLAVKRKKWLPFFFQALGICLVAPNPYWLNSQTILWVGVGFIFVGSLLHAMPTLWLDRLEATLFSPLRRLQMPRRAS